MGWSCGIISNKEITINEIETILEDLPKRFWNPMGFINPTHDNGWGWSTCVDINKPDGNRFSISGSFGMSGDKAEPMANYLKDKLEEIGHIIELEYNW